MNKKKRFYGGGGTTPAQQATNSTSSQTPWAPSIPYLQQGINSANQWAAQGPAQYTPWSQYANLTPNQLAAMQGVTNYTNSAGTQNFMNTAANGVQNLISNNPNAQMNMGQQGMSNALGYMNSNSMMDPSQAANQMAYGNNTDPYLQKNVGSALQQLSNNFQMNTLPGLRHQAIGDGTYGSSRNEMAEGSAAGALSGQMNQTAQEMYNNAYNTNQQNSLAALGQNAQQQSTQAGLANQIFNSGTGQQQTAQNIGMQNYNNALFAPLQMLQAQGGVGAQAQQQNQQQINDSTNRWNFAQQAPWTQVQQYANLINPTSNQGQSTSGQGYQSNYLPQASGAALATGGLLSGVGLAASMYN